MTFKHELVSIEGNVAHNFETQFLDSYNKLNILSSIQDLEEWEGCHEVLNSESSSSPKGGSPRKSEGTNRVAKKETTAAGITSKIVGKDKNYLIIMDTAVNKVEAKNVFEVIDIETENNFHMVVKGEYNLLPSDFYPVAWSNFQFD